MKTYSEKWLNHFRNHANAARESVKEITQVGACLIGNDNEVLLTSYNGPAIGVRDTPERRSRKDGLKYKYSSHAERNLIAFAARNGLQTKGLTIYATHHPCSACACEIVQAGISCVIIGHGEFKSSDGDIEHAENILKESNIQIIHHKGSEELERAFALSKALLSNKYDLEGKSIHRHSVRVVNSLPPKLPVGFKIVAALHETLNYNEISLDTIASLFDTSIAETVYMLTYVTEHEDVVKNIAKSNNTVAKIVKMADLADDLDPARLFDVDTLTEDEKDFKWDRLIHYRKILFESITTTEWRYLEHYDIGMFGKFFKIDPHVK